MELNKIYALYAKKMRCWYIVCITAIILLAAIMGVAIFLGHYWMDNENYHKKSCDTIEYQTIMVQVCNNPTAGDSLKKHNNKIDSLIATINNYQKKINSLDSIARQNTTVQDDIRQETNNIINKFNGWIGFWMVILTLVCGLAPILTTFRHYTSSREILEAQKNEIKDFIKKKEKEKWLEYS